MHRLLVLLALAGLFAACVTIDSMLNRQRQAYVQKNGLTGKDSVHVIRGRIYQGMPSKHALAALGTPSTSDTTTTRDGPRIRYVYRARPNAFDPGNLRRAYVYALSGRVTGWENLDKIPRFEAYYEGGV